MDQIKEIITTKGVNNNTANVVTAEEKATSMQTTQYVVYFIFGILEALLAFRLIWKLTGASLSSGFVSGIYGITSIFILPFEGIFHRAVAQGIETVAVFEPSTLVEIIVYALLGWGIVKLVAILSGEKQELE